MIFQYYFPNLRYAMRKPADVERVGLADVFRDCLAARVWKDRVGGVDVHRGPDNGAGAILAMVPINGETPVIGYHPKDQAEKWTEIPTGNADYPSYWLGWSTSNPPRPETLRRDKLVDGYEFELGDGQLWECPVIRRPGNRPNVPQIWGVGPSGEFLERIAPDYEAMWQLSGEMLECFCGAREMEKPETFRASVRCLALNYRVGPQEVSVLGILDSENYRRVFWCAFDGEKLDAILASPEGQALLREYSGEDGKKNTATEQAPGGTSSTPGPSAVSPIIAPLGASCSLSPTATAGTSL